MRRGWQLSDNLQRAENRRLSADEMVGFARGRPGDWEAICINLDIAVQGETFGQVQSDLRAAVADYLAAVEDEADEKARGRLSSRTAPLWLIALWVVRVTISTWRHRRGSEAGDWAATFPIPASA